MYPIKPKELYTELMGVGELDILGMSPYGDDSLIKIINKMSKVKVYVYNKDCSEETEIWNKKLKCPHEIIDSDLLQS